VLFVSGLLHAERQRRGTCTGTRALTCFKQAIVVIRWFLDGTRIDQLARDNAIGRSTAYDYLHEGIDVLSAQAPNLEAALLAAKMAGYDHVNHRRDLDRDRPVPHPGPHPRVDLLWSGKPDNHGGNIQVITRPGRLAAVEIAGTPGPRTRHDRAAGTHPDAAPAGGVDRRPTPRPR